MTFGKTSGPLIGKRVSGRAQLHIVWSELSCSCSMYVCISLIHYRTVCDSVCEREYRIIGSTWKPLEIFQGFPCLASRLFSFHLTISVCLGGTMAWAWF